jgi:hypothetical protein
MIADHAERRKRKHNGPETETWTLTTKDEDNLCIFKRQILRKIFGLVNIDSIWTKRNNVEIDNLAL